LTRCNAFTTIDKARRDKPISTIAALQARRR
jgi:hypothetical protein